MIGALTYIRIRVKLNARKAMYTSKLKVNASNAPRIARYAMSLGSVSSADSTSSLAMAHASLSIIRRHRTLREPESLLRSSAGKVVSSAIKRASA